MYSKYVKRGIMRRKKFKLKEEQDGVMRGERQNISSSRMCKQ